MPKSPEVAGRVEDGTEALPLVVEGPPKRSLPEDALEVDGCVFPLEVPNSPGVAGLSDANGEEPPLVVDGPPKSLSEVPPPKSLSLAYDIDECAFPLEFPKSPEVVD